MHPESHHDTSHDSQFVGDTIIDSNLEVQTERERTRQKAYQRVKGFLQRRVDKYSATIPKPVVPGAAFQGVEAGLKAPDPEDMEGFKILGRMNEGRATDDDVRSVLATERDKAKDLIESEERKMNKALDDGLKGLGPAISTDELINGAQGWENSPAKLALTAEIKDLNRLIDSLEVAN